jgi:uncharacterized protein YutE (UPF0331/DUF86 family)
VYQGFSRGILPLEYLEINWDEVYYNLKQIDQFYEFMNYVEKWLAQRN